MDGPGDNDGDGLTALQEWRRGWLAVLVGMIGTGFSAIHAFSLGVFAAPLHASLGWSVSEVYSGLSIGVIAATITLPIAGICVDRWGTRSVTLLSVPFLGIALAALSLSGHDLRMWCANWLVLSVAVPLAGTSMWMAEVSRLFHKARGAALAVALAGSSLMQIVAPPLSLLLIDRFGWRQAYVVLGIGLALILTPLVFLMEKCRDVPVETNHRGHAGSGWRHCRDRRLVLLSFGAFLVIGAISAFLNLFVPLMVFGGLPRQSAAAAAGLIGVGCLVGGLIGGALLDRLNPRLIVAAYFTIPAVPCLLILAVGSAHLSTVPLLPFVVAALLGIGFGAILSAFPFLTALYFDLRHFGFLFSVVAAFMSLGVGLGTYLFARSFDVTGSYDTGLAYLVPAFAIAPLLVALLGVPPAAAGFDQSKGFP